MLELVLIVRRLIPIALPVVGQALVLPVHKAGPPVGQLVPAYPLNILRLQLRLVLHVQLSILTAMPVLTPIHALAALAVELLTGNFAVLIVSIILQQVQAVFPVQLSTLPVLLVTPMHALPVLAERFRLENIAVVATNIIILPLPLVLPVQL